MKYLLILSAIVLFSCGKKVDYTHDLFIDIIEHPINHTQIIRFQFFYPKTTTVRPIDKEIKIQFVSKFGDNYYQFFKDKPLTYSMVDKCALFDTGKPYSIGTKWVHIEWIESEGAVINFKRYYSRSHQ